MPRWVAIAVLVCVFACGGLLLADSILADSLLADSGSSADDQAPAVTLAQASNPTTVAPAARRGGKAAPLPAITPEREAAVLTFVQRNHAELAALLAHLKANQRDEYERAIREIFRVTERLATIQERDTTQYELEIDLWTAQSQVQLLAAKLKMGITDELRDELRKALAVQADARLALLQHEREKAKNRLARLENDIQQFEADREKTIERQLNVLTRAAGIPPAGKTTKAKKAAE